MISQSCSTSLLAKLNLDKGKPLNLERLMCRMNYVSQLVTGNKIKLLITPKIADMIIYKFIYSKHIDNQILADRLLSLLC